MIGYVPFNHKHLEYRKDKHKIARVFLAGHQIYNADEGFVAEFMESYCCQSGPPLSAMLWYAPVL